MKTTSKKRRPGRPRGHRISVKPPEQLLAVQIRLGLSDAVLTYRDAAAELTARAGFKVGVGAVWNFAHGINPASGKLCKLFGVPPRVTVTACAGCGEVHLRRGRCPHAPKPTPPAWVSAAADWLAGRERVEPAAVRVYGRRGKAVTW